MALSIPQSGVLTNVLNKSVTGVGTLNNPNASPTQQAAAISALSTAVSNTAVVATQILNASPAVLNTVQGANALLNINNLTIQNQLLNDAIASGDNSKIIQASLDFGASVAGVLALVPGLQPEALAISLLIASASALYRNRESIDGAINDLLNPNPLTPNKPPLLPLIPGDANANGIPDTHESTVDFRTKTAADAAKAALLPRRDPLTFDLNGDGLNTVGVSTTNPILFDHNADGIKTGTGWVQPDDAFLVLDKNGNGTIDNGRELFGDATLKSNGQLASNGFDALADLDTIANGGNADGIVNASDTQYAGLRLWRDLNQDGISQTGELFTLASQNIIGINVASNAHSQILPNGNQLADTGSFIKADGTQGEVGAVTGDLGDINLASDTFHRSFTTTLDTSSVATLPDMQGSGVVRDLREAATQSTTLQNVLTNYSQATTHAAQIAQIAQVAQIDQLMDAWADTGGMAETMTQRVNSLTGYTKADGTVIPYTLKYQTIGSLSNTRTDGTYTPEFAAKIAEWEQNYTL